MPDLETGLSVGLATRGKVRKGFAKPGRCRFCHAAEPLLTLVDAARAASKSGGACRNRAGDSPTSSRIYHCRNYDGITVLEKIQANRAGRRAAVVRDNLLEKETTLRNVH